jgi:hypothetical protein
MTIKNNGNDEYRDVNTGRFISNSGNGAYSYIQSNKVYALTSGLDVLENIANPELTASWNQLYSNSVWAAWVMNNKIILENNTLSFKISMDSGKNWNDWSEGASAPFSGYKLFGFIQNYDEIWVASDSSSGSTLWYSQDNGKTWKDGPEDPANPSIKFGLPSGFQCYGIYYRE